MRLNSEARHVLKVLWSRGRIVEGEQLIECWKHFERAVSPRTDAERDHASRVFWQAVAQARRKQRGQRTIGRQTQPLRRTFHSEVEQAIRACLTENPHTRPSQHAVAIQLAEANGVDTTDRKFDEYFAARTLRRQLSKHLIDWDAIVERAWLQWFFDMQTSARN
jgi:hypothetical protein